MVGLVGDPLLPGDEREPLAEFEQKVVQLVDERLLQLALADVRTVRHAQELEHARVLEDVVSRCARLQLGDLGAHRLATVLPGGKEPFIVERADLPVELS
ncbi:MAG: hypothetical protein FWH11_09930 [Micrococcales bacterium]|nr:hypothetical protein [Micrococcales bacterium]